LSQQQPEDLGGGNRNAILQAEDESSHLRRSMAVFFRAAVLVSFLSSWDRCDEHAVGLSILPYEEIVAAAVDEADFLVEGDGAGVALPDT
jgi:hypothetical protein